MVCLWLIQDGRRIFERAKREWFTCSVREVSDVLFCSLHVNIHNHSSWLCRLVYCYFLSLASCHSSASCHNPAPGVSHLEVLFPQLHIYHLWPWLYWRYFSHIWDIAPTCIEILFHSYTFAAVTRTLPICPLEPLLMLFWGSQGSMAYCHLRRTQR